MPTQSTIEGTIASHITYYGMPEELCGFVISKIPQNLLEVAAESENLLKICLLILTNY